MANCFLNICLLGSNLSCERFVLFVYPTASSYVVFLNSSNHDILSFVCWKPGHWMFKVIWRGKFVFWVCKHQPAQIHPAVSSHGFTFDKSGLYFGASYIVIKLLSWTFNFCSFAVLLLLHQNIWYFLFPSSYFPFK